MCRRAGRASNPILFLRSFCFRFQFEVPDDDHRDSPLAAPLATARSFHWGRWQRSLERLKSWLPQGSPGWIASGAGLGALGGEKLIGPGRPLLDGLK